MSTIIIIRKCWQVVAVVAAFCVAAPAQSENLPPLITPAGKNDPAAQKIDRKTNYTLREQLYIAMPDQYQIVKVDFGLLEKPDTRFTIDAFGTSITVQAVETDSAASSDERNRMWQGRIIDPVPKAIANSATSEADRQALADSLLAINIWIMTTSREVPQSLLQERVAGNDRTPTMGTHPDSTAMGEEGIVRKMTVRMVNASWLLADQGRKMVLQPIDEDPRYHLLFELDPSKLARGPNADAVRADYVRFKQQLATEKQRFPDQQTP